MSADALLAEKGLPAAKLAEDMILGGLVSGRVFPVAVQALLSTEDFASEAHRRIFRACGTLSDKGADVNRVSVAEHLIASGELESVGGMSYLADLEGYPEPVNLEGFVQSVKNASTRRKTIHACYAVAERCMASPDSAETLEYAESILTKIGEGSKARVNLQSSEHVKQSGDNGVNGFFYPHKQRQGSVPSPWERLDNVTGGFQAGQLIVVGAYTGVGKSAMAAQCALSAAQCGFGAALFSLEMSSQDILRRMICQRAGINGHTLYRYGLPRAEQELFQKTSADIDQSPLWIDDTAGSTVITILSAVKKHQTMFRLGLVIVDYLQLMESMNRHENRVQQITEITRGLKRLAVDQKVAVMALSQLNRASQDGNPPSLKHLRESGSIEQDEDKVILLHQPRKDEDYDGVRQAAIDTEFRVEKNRGGPTGKITLLFQRSYTRFDDPTTQPGAVQ